MILDHVISFHMISFYVIAYHIKSYRITEHHIISYHIISNRIVSYRIVLYRIISSCYIVLSYISLDKISSDHIIYNIYIYIILYNIILLDQIKSYYILLCALKTLSFLPSCSSFFPTPNHQQTREMLPKNSTFPHPRGSKKPGFFKSPTFSPPNLPPKPSPPHGCPLVPHQTNGVHFLQLTTSCCQIVEEIRAF